MSGLEATLLTGVVLGLAYALLGAAVAAVATATRTHHLVIGPIAVVGATAVFAVATVMSGAGGLALGLLLGAAFAVSASLLCEVALFARTDEVFTRVVGLVVIAAVISAFAARLLGSVTVRPDPILGLPSPGVDGALDGLLLLAPLLLGLHLARTRTQWGRRLVLVGGSAEVAARAGVSPARTRGVALVVSALAAVIAGVAVAPLTGLGLGGGAGLSVRAVAVGAVGIRRPLLVVPAGAALGIAEALGQWLVPSVGGELAVVVAIVAVAAGRGPSASRGWGRVW